MKASLVEVRRNKILGATVNLVGCEIRTTMGCNARKTNKQQTNC
jgi:hypothetical protein